MSALAGWRGERQCPECGAAFMPKKSTVRFCSRRCAATLHARQHGAGWFLELSRSGQARRTRAQHQRTQERLWATLKDEARKSDLFLRKEEWQALHRMLIRVWQQGYSAGYHRRMRTEPTAGGAGMSNRGQTAQLPAADGKRRAA